MLLIPGQRVGPYEVIGPIGAGGMGEVYRARDARLNRDVALKVLPENVAGDPDRLARFAREAQTLAALNHSNIAHVYGLESVANAPGAGDTRVERHALVMELVEGEDLSAIIARGAMPLADALPVARQIAEALEAAHDLGIVHRDLKPGNVKVRPDGVVKVLDFGLAKAMAPDGSGASAEAMNSPTLTARATQLGVILGTAAYMAPEQAKGRAIDKRADIWAFGVVLYEMLTGRRGYDAEDVSDTLAAVLTRDVDWTALPAATPSRLRTLLRECLVRDPKQRLRDIGTARIEIAKIESGVTEPSVGATETAPSPRTRHLTPWLLAGVMTVAAIVAVVWPMNRGATPVPALAVRSRIAFAEDSSYLALSRDGSRVVYDVQSGPKGFYLASRRLDEFDAHEIPGSDGAMYPVFSPDGRWIAYTDVGSSPVRIKKISVAGGAPITLCEGFTSNGASWNDDDTIVFAASKGLKRVSASGGEPERLTTVDQTKGETFHSSPQFLPGGRQVLFTVVSGERLQFAVLDLATKTYRVVAPGGNGGRYIAPGYLTYVRNSSLFARPFDVKRLIPIGAEVPVIEGVSPFGPDYSADYAVSDSGVLAYVEFFPNDGSTLAWADRKGATTLWPGKAAGWGTGSLSPDGVRVAGGIYDDKGNSDIWVLDARGVLSRLTFGGKNDFPVWTPDGRTIIYSSALDGSLGLYSVPADGSGKPTLLLTTPAPPIPTSMTPSGDAVIFSERTPGDKLSRIFILPMTHGQGEVKPVALHDAQSDESDGRVSPNGRWIAYASSETGAREIYVQPFPGPGAKKRISTQGGAEPRWNPTGRELLFWRGYTQLSVVDFTASPVLQLGTPRVLFTLAVNTTWDVAPDGQRFLVELPVMHAGAVSQMAIVTNWFDELRQRAPAGK